MSKKSNEMLVLVASDNKDARDHAVGLITNILSVAQRDKEEPLNQVSRIVVKQSGLKAGSLMAVMEEFRPGLTGRMHPAAAEAMQSKQKLKDMSHNAVVGIAIENIATLSHKQTVTRHILKSDRSDAAKVEELKHVLDPNVSIRGKPADVQAVIEMALYGQEPKGPTNATITYKDGKPCKTIGTF